MRRNSLAALVALAALPVAVIMSTAMSTAATTPAPPPGTSAPHADAGNSGKPPPTVQMDGCTGGQVNTSVSWDAGSGEKWAFTINAPDGSHVTVTPDDATVNHMDLGLQPSTKYTLTVTVNGTSSDPIPMTTPAC